MAWVETTSLTFTARHDDGDTEYAEGLLDRLEALSLRLEDRFDRVPTGITVVVHPGPWWLNAAHPFLPAVRRASAPAGRRYLAGWPTTTEVHVLGESALLKRAAGEGSLEALRGTAERLYTQLVVSANNDSIPPPWNPSSFRTYLEWAWLIEGAAQYFSRQVDLFRAAVILRLREGGHPEFPPGRRDAIILGGTIFEVLEDHGGGEACEQIVSRLKRGGPAANLEAAFRLRIREIEELWRQHLRNMAGRPGFPESGVVKG